jgi:hypothetical protein
MCSIDLCNSHAGVSINFGREQSAVRAEEDTVGTYLTMELKWFSIRFRFCDSRLLQTSWHLKPLPADVLSLLQATVAENNGALR